MEVPENLPTQGHLVICGYGGVGRNILQLLQSHDQPVVVIDQSEQVIQQLREEGIPYVYGNAASLHVFRSGWRFPGKGFGDRPPRPNEYSTHD